MYTDKDYPIPNRWMIGDDSYNRCPKGDLPLETFEWIKAYCLFKNGRDPNSGGWNDQAAKYNEIMIFIDNEIEKHKRENDVRK